MVLWEGLDAKDNLQRKSAETWRRTVMGREVMVSMTPGSGAPGALGTKKLRGTWARGKRMNFALAV